MPIVTDFFENLVFPDAMKTAIISLIHKKDKDAEQFASFHPISILPVDFKILSKLIASRLEDLLPKIINPDQSGFVKAPYASDNIRRLLNIINHSPCTTEQPYYFRFTQKKRLIGPSGHVCLPY